MGPTSPYDAQEAQSHDITAPTTLVLVQRYHTRYNCTILMHIFREAGSHWAARVSMSMNNGPDSSSLQRAFDTGNIPHLFPLFCGRCSDDYGADFNGRGRGSNTSFTSPGGSTYCEDLVLPPLCSCDSTPISNSLTLSLHAFQVPKPLLSPPQTT